MAVSTVTEISEGRAGTGDRENTTFVRAFRVYCTDANDGPYVVTQHASIPRLLDAYSSGNDSLAGAKAVNIDCQLSGDSRLHWIVTVTYETKVTNLPDPSSIEIPYLAPAVWTWGGESFSKIVESAPDPETQEFGPVRNTAGFRYDPPPERDASLQTLSIDKAVPPGVTPQWLFEFVDKVNDSTFIGFGRYKVKMRPFTMNGPLFSNGYEYYNLRLEFVINPDKQGWIQDILNAGYKERIDTASAVGPKNARPILVQGETVSEPWPLKRDGTAMPADAYSPIYRQYEFYETADFNQLPIY